MVQLRFRTIAASPVFSTVQPGQVVSVSDEQAEALIAGGYAELVQGAEQSAAPVLETGALGGAENAMLSRGGPKKRGTVS